MKKKELSPSC